MILILLSFQSTTSFTESNNAEEVSVFCRVRPPNNDNDENCIRVIDEKTVQLTPPESSRAFFTWGFNEKEVQYTFKKVFDTGSTQKQIFDKVILFTPLCLVGFATLIPSGTMGFKTVCCGTKPCRKGEIYDEKQPGEEKFKKFPRSLGRVGKIEFFS